MNSDGIITLMDSLPSTRGAYSLREWLTRRTAQAELVRATVKVVKCTDVPDPEAPSGAFRRMHNLILRTCPQVTDEAIE